MYSSANRSSSAIVIPGSSRSSSSASVPATTAPAAAISSISYALLRMIIRATCPFPPCPGTVPGRGPSGRWWSCGDPLERFLDFLPHLVDRALRMERHEIPGDAVVLDDRLGLLVIGGEALRDHLGRVVRATLAAIEQPLGRHVVR